MPPSVQPAPAGPTRERWLSPAGISAIAAGVTCVLALVTWLVASLNTPDQPTSPQPSVPVSVGVAADKLFVYGSTMPGQSRYGYIEHYVESSTPDAVEGLLYDSGQDYPLAKFGPGEPIPGYVLTIHEDSVEQFFTSMTQMESGLFALVEVRTRSGERVRAYEWIGATDGLVRIPRWDG